MGKDASELAASGLDLGKAFCVTIIINNHLRVRYQ